MLHRGSVDRPKEERERFVMSLCRCQVYAVALNVDRCRVIYLIWYVARVALVPAGVETEFGTRTNTAPTRRDSPPLRCQGSQGTKCTQQLGGANDLCPESEEAELDDAHVSNASK